MRYLKALLLGAAATTVLAIAAVSIVSTMAVSGAVARAHVGVGGLVLVDVRRSGDATETTVGAALPLLAGAGGTLNAAALALLGRRRRQGAPFA